MKKLGTLLFLTSIASFSTYAGTITVKGVSNIGKTPDYLELNIRTVSKCFDSAKESNAAAGELAKELQDLVKTHIDTSAGDEIIVTAGISSRRKETVSVFDDSRNRNITEVICERGWTSSRSITLKSGNLGIFEVLNPLLLDKVDQVESQARAADKGSVSASVGSPIARLLPESIVAMEEQALKESLLNASKKFKVIKDLCQLTNASIANISESSAIARPYRDGLGTNSGANSINLAQQYVHLGYNITFEFDNTSASCSEQAALL